MDTADLVLDALRMEPARAASAADVLRSGIACSPQQLLGTIDEFDEKRIWEDATAIAVHAYKNSVFSDGEARYFRIMLLARDAEAGNQEALSKLRDCLREMHEALSLRIRQEARSEAIGNFPSALQFLHSLFGSEAAEIIGRVASVQTASARRWIAGGRTSWGREHRICQMALPLYILLEERGKDEDEVRRWFRSPIIDGHSPYDLLQAGNFQKLRRELVAQGIM